MAKRILAFDCAVIGPCYICKDISNAWAAAVCIEALDGCHKWLDLCCDGRVSFLGGILAEGNISNGGW